MTDINPYNCTQPGNLFTGYEDELAEMTAGFRNVRSYAVLGGRKCGKTSLLLRVQDRVRRDGVPGFSAFACMIDLAAQVPHSVSEFFQILHDATVKDCGAPAWVQASATQPYQDFLRRIAA